MPDPLGDFSFTWPFYAAALLGYLLGSIPVGRLKGPVPAWLPDGAKGALAALGAGWFGTDFAVLAGGGAVLGQSFPLWRPWRGGNPTAPAFGALVVIAPIVALLAALTWLAAAAACRIAAVASLTAAAAACLAAWVLRDVRLWDSFASSLQVFEFAVFLTAIVWVHHAGAVRRLLAGTEPRLGPPPPDRGRR